jgi:hypothetical protein
MTGTGLPLLKMAAVITSWVDGPSRGVVMSRLVAIAIAFGMLLVAGCGSQEMQALQDKCNSGDKSACAQIQPGGVYMPLPMGG